MIPVIALVALRASNPYAQLGALIPEADWSAYAATTRVPSAETPLLAVQRKAAERWGGVAARFEKMAGEPYASGAVEPADLPGLRRLAEFVAVAARVRFADGERAAGTTLLLDLLRMARQTADAPSEARAFDAFAERLSDLPLAECDRVRTEVDRFLGGALVVSPDEPTRLRLLRLHMRIEAYRWRYLKLPETLEGAAPAGETVDPLGRAFVYAPSAFGYRLEGESGTRLGRGASEL